MRSFVCFRLIYVIFRQKRRVRLYRDDGVSGNNFYNTVFFLLKKTRNKIFRYLARRVFYHKKRRFYGLFAVSSDIRRDTY